MVCFFDRGRRKYDLHPIVRSFAYDRLADKTGVHTQFRNYFNVVPLQVLSTGKLEELEPLIGFITIRFEQDNTLKHSSSSETGYKNHSSVQSVI